jgi:hypothetical protein
MEQLNDIERQYQVRNKKIIREIGYDRSATNAINSVKAFRKTFFDCYKPVPEATEMFDRLEKYLEALAKFSPKARKE